MSRKFGFSFSWKRATGLSGAKGRLSRATGIPLTKSGRERKIGRMASGGSGCLLPIILAVVAALCVFAYGQSPAPAGDAPTTVTVPPAPLFWTTNNVEFHYIWCTRLDSTKDPRSVSRAEIEKRHLRPCKSCILSGYQDPEPRAFPTIPKATPSSATSESAANTVYVTTSGAKYHRANCQYLRKSRRPMSLEQARAAGYTPCSRCKPPQ